MKCWRWCWLVVAMGVGGCDSRDGGSSVEKAGTTPAGQKIQILASVYPVADVVQRVGGEFAEVQWLAEGPQRPEEVESTAELRQRAAHAAVVVTSGPWDRWAYGELTPEARAERVIEPERMVAARGAAPDAYTWLDPAVMRELIEAVRERLTVIDPAHEAAYRTNAAARRAEVDAVDAEFKAALGANSGRRVVTARPVWSAMAARYGLTVVSPARAGEERLSAGDFKELSAAAREAGARAVYATAWTPAAVRGRIAEQTKLRVLTLDGTGTSAADGRSTWGKVMRFNLGALREGLE